MLRSRDTKDAPQDDRDPRHRRLIDRGHCATAIARGPCAFSRSADQEAGLVYEIDYGQVKRIAEIDESSHLLASRRIQSAAALLRIVRHHSDRVTIKPRKSRDKWPPVISPDLEKRITIKHKAEQPAHIIGLSAVARDD